MKIKHGRMWPYVFLAPFVLSYALFSLYPVFHSFLLSLTDWSGLNMTQKNWVGLQNYVRIFTQDPLFYKSIWVTVKLLLLSLPLTIVFGLLMAQFLFTLRRGRKAFQTLNFFPYITTPVAVGIIFAFLFDWNIGVVNTVLTKLGLIAENVNWLGTSAMAPLVVAVLCMWKNFGYFMVFYLAGLSSIDETLYEAARVDGSNAVQTFFSITLPQLRPINVFIIINSTIGGLQMFDEPNLLFSSTASSAGKLVGGPERSVLTAVWYFYDTTFRNTSRFGYGSAIAFSLFLIICLISLVNILLLSRKEE